MKPTAPGSSSSYICLRSTFPLHFYSDLLNQKYKNNFLHLILFAIYYFNLLQFSGIVARKGLTTPLTRRVPRCCYLCPGVVYVVLLGSPTGPIALVFSRGKYLSSMCCIIPSSLEKYRRSPSRERSGD